MVDDVQPKVFITQKQDIIMFKFKNPETLPAILVLSGLIIIQSPLIIIGSLTLGAIGAFMFFAGGFGLIVDALER